MESEEVAVVMVRVGQQRECVRCAAEARRDDEKLITHHVRRESDSEVVGHF